MNKPWQKMLYDLQDVSYRDFQAKLIPDMDPGRMIGVRTPQLRALAKELKKQPELAEEFLNDLPHTYFDEDQLHAFLIAEEKSFETCIRLTETFLPYIDNWATCDQLSPKVFRKHTDELFLHICLWIASGKTFVIRFGIGMLMQHYLDDAFDPAYPEMVADIRSREYYVNMMIGWYFATALAKQYDAVIPYIEEERLGLRAHNIAIQKCLESRRISPEQKAYLRTLKINSKERLQEQTDRIRFYETILSNVQEALEAGKTPGDDRFLAAQLAELDCYYGSKEWWQDLRADEEGLLPENLKRGVLSEDGIYSVLDQ